MADALWPSGMRRAGSLGVSGGPQSNIDAFQPQIGPPITRRKSTYNVKSYPIEMQNITTAERDIWLTFFHDTLKDGNLPFMWVDPMKGIVGGDYTYQRCKIVPASNGPAYSETRVTPTSYNLSFNLVLL